VARNTELEMLLAQMRVRERTEPGAAIGIGHGPGRAVTETGRSRSPAFLGSPQGRRLRLLGSRRVLLGLPCRLLFF
jgi:hypothetical protein